LPNTIEYPGFLAEIRIASMKQLFGTPKNRESSNAEESCASPEKIIIRKPG